MFSNEQAAKCSDPTTQLYSPFLLIPASKPLTAAFRPNKQKQRRSRKSSLPLQCHGEMNFAILLLANEVNVFIIITLI